MPMKNKKLKRMKRVKRVKLRKKRKPIVIMEKKEILFRI